MYLPGFITSKKLEIVKLRAELETILVQLQMDFGGGCSLEKAMVLAGLIWFNQLKTTIDLGVYRGRSFFPQALAHRNYTGGIVYGIDPYSKQAAQESDPPEAIAVELEYFIEHLDYDKVYQEVINFRVSKRFEVHSHLLRETSDEAIFFFKKLASPLGLIHIDGNHDTSVVLNDVKLYLPLLAQEGFIVLDDISWASVQPAREYLNEFLTSLCTFQSMKDDFEVFWNGHELNSHLRHQWLIDSLFSS